MIDIVREPSVRPAKRAHCNRARVAHKARKLFVSSRSGDGGGSSRDNARKIRATDSVGLKCTQNKRRARTQQRCRCDLLATLSACLLARCWLVLCTKVYLALVCGHNIKRRQYYICLPLYLYLQQLISHFFLRCTTLSPLLNLSLAHSPYLSLAIGLSLFP